MWKAQGAAQEKSGPVAVPSLPGIGAESNAQFETAVAAATLLSQVVGPPGATIEVSIEGHANSRPSIGGKGDGPNSPEYITVQVRCVPTPDAPTKPKRARKSRAKATAAASK